jgi:hypothetical protein
MSTYAQSNSIRESLERLRPDFHSCLMIYEAPKDQVAALTGAPGEVVDRNQIKENDRQIEKYVDVALYNRKQVPPQVLLNLISSHPVVIWDGIVFENPHCGLPEESLAPDPTAEDVERVLTNLRDCQRIKDGRSEMEALGRMATGLVHELVSTNRHDSAVHRAVDRRPATK